MYLPALKSAQVAKRFRLGAHTAVVVTDCESDGMISYMHVLYVIPDGAAIPVFAVAAELSQLLLDQKGSQTGGDEGAFLGVFPGNGHRNLGMSPDWLDLEKFTTEALKIAAQHLQVTDAPVPLRRYTEFYN
ncbi:MAG: hypothetical protein GYB67_15965 [Chloroflexi bacterium]|nr:hypothetical protein [Chloroflexota bacterium]